MNASRIHPIRPDRLNQSRTHDGRVQTSSRRGPRQSYEHYLDLARDRARAGDPIEAERYYQYAEHYLRSMGNSAA